MSKLNREVTGLEKIVVIRIPDLGFIFKLYTHIYNC